MVESGRITDSKSLEAWLQGQPREVAIWIACRAAARSLPLWWSAAPTGQSGQGSGRASLTTLRHLLMSFVFVRAANPQLTSLLAAATDAANGATSRSVTDSAMEDFAQVMKDGGPYDFLIDATLAAGAALNACAQATASLPDGSPIPNAMEACAKAERAIFYKALADVAGAAGAEAEEARRARANSTAEEVKTAIWPSVQRDAEVAGRGDLPESFALWQDGQGLLADTWESLETSLRAVGDESDWAFWIAWYDALLQGRPMLGDAARSQKMLERIARIDQEAWNGGPEAVNPVIRGIWELYRLRSEVAALQAERDAFLAARASEAHRRHNQPPDGLVDDTPEVARQITIIWDGLDDARKELEQDAPDKGRLREIGERMLEGLYAVRAYCVRVADNVVMAAATQTGKVLANTAWTALVAVLDHIANNGRLMQFAKDLVVDALGALGG